MAFPPISPLRTSQGRNLSYFEYLTAMVHPYVKQEGVHLSFLGYNDLLSRYFELQEGDVKEAWELMKEINAWTEYLSSVANLVQRMYLDAETDKLAVTSLVSIEADAKKVANGDRLANKDERVINARKRRNLLKSFYDELDSKVKFLERAYYHCKATADRAPKEQKDETYANA